MFKSLKKTVGGLCEFCDRPAKHSVHGAVSGEPDEEGRNHTVYGNMKLCENHRQERLEGVGNLEPQYE